MPTIKIDKKRLAKLVSRELREEELSKVFSDMGASLEGINDKEISVEAFANRPDLLSCVGIARAMRYFLSIDKNIKKYSAKLVDFDKSKYIVNVDKSVSKVRPYTACAIAKGICFNDELIKEIIQIQEMLHVTFGRKRKKMAIGIYPLEKISLPISYRGEKPKDIIFKPLEANETMNAIELLERHPTGKEYAKLLEGLDLFPCFRDSLGNVLSVPPIVNSDDTGRITKNTTDVFIECSGFDLEYLKAGLSIISCALIDMGARIEQMKIIYPDFEVITPDLSNKEIDFDISYAQKILGIKLDLMMVKSAFLKMGIGFDQKNKKAIIPPYRFDILSQIDLVEDIAIGVGYDNIPEKIADIYTESSEENSSKIANIIREILIGAGFIEVKNYSLIGAKDIINSNIGMENTVEIENPNTIDYSFMRKRIRPSIFITLAQNKTREFPQSIFEIGRCFEKKGDRDFIECERLGCAISSKNSDFTKIKQVLDVLFSQLDLRCSIVESCEEGFIKGRAGKIMYGEKEIGSIGEIEPRVISAYGLDMPTSFFELELEILFDIITRRN